ncbi:MAG: hypothetical protein IPH31_11945 [Lewinellaceae bacterium]|nr:hypothetical protein [Lewinellaceae bacterium]
MKNRTTFLSFGKPINSLIQPEERRLRFVTFLLVMSLLVQNTSVAQPSCDYPVQCYDTGDPNDYTIISGPFGLEAKISWLILNNIILPHIDPFNQHDAQHIAQRWEIRSPINIDVPYTFAEGSELVFATPSGRVQVNSDLTVNSSHLHGCEELWNGLNVEENGKLIAYDNCIEDAVVAIRLFSGAEFEIKENSFKRNAFSIFGGRENILDHQEAFITPVGAGISGNDISGADDLIEPFDGFLRPYNAIRLHSVAEITIGGGDEINIIHDFAHSNPNTLSPVQALFAFNSNLSVQKTRFYNIGYELNSGGYALYSYNEGTQKQLNIFGLGKNNTIPTFQDCQTGIFSGSNDLTVQNCFLILEANMSRSISQTFHTVLMFLKIALSHTKHLRFLAQQANILNAIYIIMFLRMMSFHWITMTIHSYHLELQDARNIQSLHQDLWVKARRNLDLIIWEFLETPLMKFKNRQQLIICREVMGWLYTI